jgi:hypothetical protein
MMGQYGLMGQMGRGAGAGRMQQGQRGSPGGKMRGGKGGPGMQGAMTEASLAAAAPEQQKQLLGECLFPLISQVQPAFAGKITGMLLEMDNGELLNLLESPEALNAKIVEAVSALEMHAAEGEQQKQLLGECLFPLISQVQPAFAGKIMSMLLEMDNGELHNLLVSPEALNAKIVEAVSALEMHESGMKDVAPEPAVVWIPSGKFGDRRCRDGGACHNAKCGFAHPSDWVHYHGEYLGYVTSPWLDWSGPTAEDAWQGGEYGGGELNEEESAWLEHQIQQQMALHDDELLDEEESAWLEQQIDGAPRGGAA